MPPNFFMIEMLRFQIEDRIDEIARLGEESLL